MFKHTKGQKERWKDRQKDKQNLFYSTFLATAGASKITTGVNTTKVDLSSLKSEVDKLDTDKVKTVPTGLSKLKKLVDVVKKTVYDKLILNVLIKKTN